MTAQETLELVMTAHYGPTGIHQSRCGTDGRPDRAKCGDCWERVSGRMTESADRIRLIVCL